MIRFGISKSPVVKRVANQNRDRIGSFKRTRGRKVSYRSLRDILRRARRRSNGIVNPDR